MTDPTQPTEPAKLCRSCGNFYAAKYEETHKTKGCPARIANTFRQYREQHGGIHVALDDRLANERRHQDDTNKSLDDDIKALFDWKEQLEQQPQTAAAAPAGITVGGYLDDTEDQDDDPADDADEDALPEPATAPVTDAQTFYGPTGGPVTVTQ